MMHIVYSPYFKKIIDLPPISEKSINLPSPIFVQFTFFDLIYGFMVPPILTMVHLHMLDAPACLAVK